MDVRPIRSEADLTWALREVSPYFDQPPEPGSADADRFDVLSTLIEAYEARHHALPVADPAAVLRFAIAELGHSQSELSSLLGSRSRASEVLAGKRPLTLAMITTIAAAWHLPVAALVSVKISAKAA